MKIKKNRWALILALILCSGCVGITASPYNEEEQCWEDGVEVASEIRIFGGCDDGLVITKKEGELWLFANGCIPSDFIQIDNKDYDFNFCEE